MARVGRATVERPLEGRTIVVTRARAQAQRFVELLEAAGARVLQAPTIVIEPPASWEPLDTALAALESFAWVIFTSVNGVAMVDRRLAARSTPWAAIARKRVAAIGPATADALAEHGVRPEIVPSEYRAEALVERLPRRRRLDHDGGRLEHARARGLQELDESLRLGAGPGDDDRPALERTPRLGRSSYARHVFPGSSGAIDAAPCSSSESATRRPRRSALSTGPLALTRSTLRPSSLATSAVILSVVPSCVACAATGELHDAPSPARHARSADAHARVAA